MKLVELDCPSCGAQMDYDPEKKTAFCSFCGKKLLIIDQNKDRAEQLKNMPLNEAEERLAAQRKANLLKAQNDSDRRKDLKWEEDRQEFREVSRKAWSKPLRKDEGDYVLIVFIGILIVGATMLFLFMLCGPFGFDLLLNVLRQIFSP